MNKTLSICAAIATSAILASCSTNKAEGTPITINLAEKGTNVSPSMSAMADFTQNLYRTAVSRKRKCLKDTRLKTVNSSLSR